MFETLITFYTPTYRRPKALAENVASVRRQSLARWEHVIIPDPIGIGIDGMFSEIKNNLDKLHGRYIYILQDDDYLASASVVKELFGFIFDNLYPPVVICKNEKNERIQPERWRMSPELGHIDLGSYIVRRDVFFANAAKFGQRYEGDFDFIDALWKQGIEFSWWDFVFARASQVGKGKPE